MKFLLLILTIISNLTFSQTKDIKKNTAIATNFIEKKSKNLKCESTKTLKPIVIKLKRKDLPSQPNIKQLLNVIPDSCEIISCELIVKNNNQVTSLTNEGNNILTLVSSDCKSIYIDNLISSCPKSHNANYKIIFE